MHGVPEEDDERSPRLVFESLFEVHIEEASLKGTEQAWDGSFFIGVNGGVLAAPDLANARASSSAPEELPESRTEGDESGVSKGVLGNW